MRVKYSLDDNKYVEHIKSFIWRDSVIEFQSSIFNSVSVCFDIEDDALKATMTLLKEDWADLDMYPTSLIIDNQSRGKTSTGVTYMSCFSDWFANLEYSQAKEVYRCSKMFCYGIVFEEQEYIDKCSVADVNYITEYYNTRETVDRSEEIRRLHDSIVSHYHQLRRIEVGKLKLKSPELYSILRDDDSELLQLSCNYLMVIDKFIEEKGFM